MANKLLNIGIVLAKHLSQYFEGIEKDEQFKPRLSEEKGNLLQVKEDGLYYGTKPPASLENLYVDKESGVDQHPDEVEGAGSKSKPLRSFAYANKIARDGTTRNILLHTEQEHICSPDQFFYLKSGKIVVSPYGKPYDDALAEAKSVNGAFSLLVENGKAPVIVFKGVVNSAYPSPTNEYTVPNLQCFQISVGTTIQFNGAILRNDLNLRVERNPDAKTNTLKYGTLSRIMSDLGGNGFFNRCKFECIGKPTFGSFDDFNPDTFTKTVDGTKITALGFLEPATGSYNVLNTKLEENMACMFVSHPGWGQPINNSLNISLLTTFKPEEFAKRVYGAKVDTQNGVKILLAPVSDVSATLFT